MDTHSGFGKFYFRKSNDYPLKSLLRRLSSIGLTGLCVKRGFTKLAGLEKTALAENMSSSSDRSVRAPSDINCQINK